MDDSTAAPADPTPVLLSVTLKDAGGRAVIAVEPGIADHVRDILEAKGCAVVTGAGGAEADILIACAEDGRDVRLAGGADLLPLAHSVPAMEDAARILDVLVGRILDEAGLDDFPLARLLAKDRRGMEIRYEAHERDFAALQRKTLAGPSRRTGRGFDHRAANAAPRSYRR